MLENGQRLFLWLGREIHPQFLQDVFGVQTLDELDSSLVRVPLLYMPPAFIWQPFFFPSPLQ
jgi:protein transport protein SEC24